jgi:ABC-type branched-subunit amino acid transport system ATPase component
VRFDGRPILTGVDLTVARGETVGLIGANGAGKSTLMAVLSGHLAAGGGTVEVLGHDVTGLAAHRRARIGVGRIFQDARLFGDLTVTETIQVALEARQRSELLPSLLALPPSRRAERAKVSEAAEVIAFLGLGRYADHAIASLSTGSRRIVELACLVAQEAKVLLLDEPTAGVAQREAEAFAPLLASIRRELDASIVIIEHDIPLVSSMSDRLACLALGAVIAEGRPDEVRRDPAVIAAYLGTDERAIRRSGTLAS